MIQFMCSSSSGAIIGKLDIFANVFKYLTCPWILQGYASLYTKNQTSMNLHLGAMSL